MRVRCLFALLLAVMLGCSSESTNSNRDRGAPADGGDAAADAMPTVDPAGGRDDLRPSCFAACQNSGFVCQARGSTADISTAELVPEEGGCVGTLKTGASTPNEKVVAMKIDCQARTICTGDAPGQAPTTCVPGTFNAFTFAYASGPNATPNVCTRD